MMKRSMAASAMTAILISTPPMQALALSLVPMSHRTTRLVSERRTTCYAKLNRIASSFDLDGILSSEKEFSSSDDDAFPSSKKKNMLKDQMRQQKQEMQQIKKRNRDIKSSGKTEKFHQYGGDFEDDASDIESRTEHENIIQNIRFSAYEIPSSLDGRRIDAVLVDLLNNESDDKGQTSSLSISRTQCGTLLSNDCVFVVPPEDALIFRNALNSHYENEGETTDVPYMLIDEYCSPIQRKSQILESQSIIVYPNRDSLFPTSSSSSTLLSNLIPPAEIVAQNIPLDILYEDEHMVVINKQAGIVVHPAAGNWDGTVVNALAYYLMNESPFGLGDFFTSHASESVVANDEDIPMDNDMNQNDAVTNSISSLRPGIVHRLDKGTSGVLIVAKTSSALATLSEAFANRKVKKQYLAVTIGNPGADQWINKPIGRHPLHRQKMRVVPDPSPSMSTRGQARLAGDNSKSIAKRGRPALSHIHTIHHDGKLSVVQVEIATGRTHQIRVHLQDHGTPIYGDDVYGLTDWNKALSLQRGITRPLLHAQKLQIDHPVTGEQMVFEAQVADDMMDVITAIWPAGQRIEF